VPIAHFHGIENMPADALAKFTTQHPVGFEVLNVSHSKDDPVGTHIISPLLNHLAINYRFILIDLPEEMDETVFKAMSQSDSIYFVTDSRMNSISETRDTVVDLEKNLSFSEDKMAIVVHEALMGVRTTVATKKELFGRKHCYSLPSVPDIEERERRSLSPYVVEEPHAEYSRIVRHIARRISNNLIGLALGSGAAFGLAHVGVLKVLERENIAVDIISGSSIGSIVASLFAVGKTAAELEAIALDINNKFQFARLLDFNLFPVRGMVPGRLVHKHIDKQLGHRTFEETRIPLKIVSANLSSREMLVYESGLIADAVRASISIPAIFDPIKYKNDWIVDGDILSPLPIRALREAGANKIIAVNDFPTPKDTLERRIVEAELGRKEEELVRRRNIFIQAGRRIRKFMGRRVLPNVLDILVNTIQAMEYEISEVEGVQADVLLRPVVPTASWVDFYKPAVFIRRGEEETVKELSKIKALVSQQNN
jgi:NTE family protein